MFEIQLESTAQALVARGKGILAADESTGTIEKRFKSVGAACTEQNRRAYRELLFSTPRLGEFISGVILFEPEVLMDGDHTLERHASVTRRTLRIVFDALAEHRVRLEAMLLKPNMVLSGKDCPQQATVSDVADATLRCIRRTVPAAVPGLVFLSGGQSDVRATEHLNAMNQGGPSPWELSFSYGRALQAPALKAWAGNA